MKTHQIIPRFLGLLAIGAVVTACSRDPKDPGIEYSPEMYVSIPMEPFTQVADSYSVFKDKMNQQLPPVGTIQRGGHMEYEFAHLSADTGKILSINLVNPVAYSQKVYDEGKVVYERFCGVCHGKKGDGKGKVAEHEAINPSPYSAAGLKEMTGGQIYHTIMMGKGVMGSYASQISYEDRWKVVHYVQTLQDPEWKTKKEIEAGMASATPAVQDSVAATPANGEEQAPVEEPKDGGDHSNANHH
jgi:mono/diheme cytochrome c family protein